MQRPSAVFNTPIVELVKVVGLHSSQNIESLHFEHKSEQETGLQMTETPSLTGSLPSEHLSLHLESVSITKFGKMQEVHLTFLSKYCDPSNSHDRQLFGQFRH